MTAWAWPLRWRETRSNRQSSHAMSLKKISGSDWAPWAYVVVCAPLVLLVVEIVRGAHYEARMIRTHMLRESTDALRARAVRRSEGLQLLIVAHEASEDSWAALREAPWLSAYWSSIEPNQTHDLYAAVVDDAGNVVLHTDPARIGRRLERGWYDRRLSEIDPSQDEPDVVWSHKSALAGDRAAYDVSVPLAALGQSLGEYHEGLSASWLDSQIATSQRTALLRWLAVLAVVGLVVMTAGGALVFLGRQQSRLWQVVHSESRQRAREIGQLGSGLAHEIRNPLHALRLNLHTLRRASAGRSPLSDDQIVATFQESEAAIDRLDGLVRDLLQYSERGGGDVSDVDLVHEVQGTLNLLADGLARQRIEVHRELSSEPALVAIDPARLRQAILNLLIFAQHRAGNGGTMDIRVTRTTQGAEIAVGNSGPVLAESLGARLFEPFQAPAETGSGLGLALVQVCVEEAGGCAFWDGGTQGNSSCRVWLPLAPRVRDKEASYET
jgi:two-component system sensor histidine kinase HydH